jgi:hypothetical protein
LGVVAIMSVINIYWMLWLDNDDDDHHVKKEFLVVDVSANDFVWIMRDEGER